MRSSWVTVSPKCVSCPRREQLTRHLDMGSHHHRDVPSKRALWACQTIVPQTLRKDDEHRRGNPIAPRPHVSRALHSHAHAHAHSHARMHAHTRRWRSIDMEALNAHGPSADAAASQEPPFAFKTAQELTFSMLAHALRSTRDGPNPYVTILLTFLQTVLRKTEGLASLERAIPWTDLAAFPQTPLSCTPSCTRTRARTHARTRNSVMCWHAHARVLGN
jgi:hypothetical protein